MWIPVCVSLVLALPAAASAPPKVLAPPIERGAFLVPAPGQASEPIWGLRGGIAIGLWPTPGPRGLIRVYAPYLDQPRLQVINFIAVEPVAHGRRSLSELEPSDLDKTAGRAFWSIETREGHPRPRAPWMPAPGRIDTVETVPRLTVIIACERFANGAQPIVEAVFRQDRPHEVTFRVFAAETSAPMQACVLTATMGNYARLRRLHLKTQVIAAETLWVPFQPDSYGFAPHRQWGVDQLEVREGEAVVTANSNEADPARAEYAKEVPSWWHYQGRPAIQSWKAPVVPLLVARVNGRTTYWATKVPIPGGIAFENFELEVAVRTRPGIPVRRQSGASGPLIRIVTSTRVGRPEAPGSTTHRPTRRALRTPSHHGWATSRWRSARPVFGSIQRAAAFSPPANRDRSRETVALEPR